MFQTTLKHLSIAMSEYGFSCQWEMVGRLFIGIDSKRSSENISDDLGCLRCRYFRRARFGGFVFWRFQEIAAIFQNLGQKRFEFLSAADFAGVKRHRVRIVIIHVLHPLRAFFGFTLTVEVEADLVGVAVRAVGECVECRFLRPRLDFFIGRIGTAGQA